MIEMDCYDEAIIDADPGHVRQAIIEEAMGHTHWWMPYWQAKPRGKLPIDQVGGVVDITVRSIVTSHMTVRTVEVSATRLRYEYIDGDYRGEGTWSFEPYEGMTKLGFRFHVQPAGMQRWLLQLDPHASEGRYHRDIMAVGFKALQQFLGKRQPEWVHAEAV